VARIGDQRQRSGQPSENNFYDHEDNIQRHSDRESATVVLGCDVMVVSTLMHKRLSASERQIFRMTSAPNQQEEADFKSS